MSAARFKPGRTSSIFPDIRTLAPGTTEMGEIRLATVLELTLFVRFNTLEASWSAGSEVLHHADAGQKPGGIPENPLWSAD
jgi:hypothetical protein